MSLKHNFKRGTPSLNLGKAGLWFPSHLCFCLCHLLSGLGPVFWCLPGLWCSYNSLGCNVNVHLLQHWMRWSSWDHGWGDELPSQGLIWGTGKRSSSALWRIQLDLTLAFNAATTIIRMTLKHRNCFTGCSFKLQMALGVARRSLPTAQGSHREKKILQEVKFLERSGRCWQREKVVLNVFFSRILTSL